jgi:alpha-tubulin suppressor-like RCC1 family protein
MGTPGDKLSPTTIPNLSVDEHREGGSAHCARSGANQTCWGSGKGTSPVAAGTWQHLSYAGASACAIDSAGTLSCWGKNTNGQLGQGDQVDRAQPTQVGTATWTDIELVVGGNFGAHACGISGGHLMCWGSNVQGQVGNNNAVASAPVDVGGGTSDWVDVEINDGSSCALKSTGALYCWGYVISGSHQNVPTLVDANTWTSFSLGPYHRCGTHDGKLYCWGSNYYGFLCQGNTAQSSTPLQIGTDIDWASAAAGGSNTCGLKQDGSLYCCGRTVFDYVYGPNTDYVSTLGQIGTDTGWSSLQIATNHICGVRAGALRCWGSNRYGQLGDGVGYFAMPRLVAPRG